MNKRYFYGTNKLADDFITNLKLIESLEGGWSEKYLDEKNEEIWLKYTIDPDKGYFWNLMLSTPKLTTEQIIEIALTTNFQDEVHAAGHRLEIEENKENEFREILINKLLELDLETLEAYEKNRIETIIISTQLTSTFNKREVLGKHYTEVNRDVEFFKTIAEKANSILKKLK